MIWSVLRWFLVMLVNLLGWVTAKFMFPIAYLTRDIPVFRDKILWLYHDDEDGLYGVDWWLGDKKRNFWTSYKWCALRNPAWNLQASLKPKIGLRERRTSKGYLSKNGVEQDIYQMAVLKYVNLFGEYKDNKGAYLSKKYSIFGKMWVTYYTDNTLYWRYSYAKRFFWRFFVELHIGTTNERYTFRFKIKYITKIL